MNKGSKLAHDVIKNKKAISGVPVWPANAKIPYEQAAREADQRRSIGWTKGEIKRWLMSKYEITSARSCERVLSRAKAIARRRTGLSVDELRQQAHNVYQSLISDPDVDPADKIRAQTRLDKLYGLAAPVQINQNLTVNKDEAANLLKDEDTVEILDVLAERMHNNRVNKN